MDGSMAGGKFGIGWCEGCCFGEMIPGTGPSQVDRSINGTMGTTRWWKKEDQRGSSLKPPEGSKAQSELPVAVQVCGSENLFDRGMRRRPVIGRSICLVPCSSNLTISPCVFPLHARIPTLSAHWHRDWQHHHVPHFLFSLFLEPWLLLLAAFWSPSHVSAAAVFECCPLDRLSMLGAHGEPDLRRPSTL